MLDNGENSGKGEVNALLVNLLKCNNNRSCYINRFVIMCTNSLDNNSVLGGSMFLNFGGLLINGNFHDWVVIVEL